MKKKKIVSTLLALLLFAGLPVSALAATWDIGNGDITVNAGSGGQTVTQGSQVDVPDDAPVITGSSDEHSVTINAEKDQTANGIETNTEVISAVREAYPTIHITAAVSNISFNLPVRKMINLGFTVLAMNAGLDSAILDPTNRDMMGLIYATEALLGQDDYCMEYISAYREGKFGPVKQA